jgi:hypothetical protein
MKLINRETQLCVIMQEVKNKGLSSFKFEGPRQKRIYHNLHELIGPAPAAFYQDACHIMKSSEFNTSSHIVAHQLREIEGFLLQTLSVIPDEKPSSIDLSNLKTDLNEISGLIPDKTEEWSEPIRMDKKLSNANSWREVHEENKAALRPRLQDINTC